MAHVVFDDDRNFYVHNRIAFFELNGISRFHAEHRRRLFTDRCAAVGRELICLAALTVTECVEVIKMRQVFRHFEHRVHGLFIGLQFNVLAVHFEQLVDAAVVFQIGLQGFFFGFIDIRIQHSVCLIGKEADELVFRNRGDGVLKAEADEDQSHASADADDGHEEPFFIPHQISNG